MARWAGGSTVSFDISTDENGAASAAPDLRTGVNVRATSGQIVVYVVEDKLNELAAALMPAITVPASGKERLLGLLERLAPLLPVESTEQTRAKTVPPDTTVHARLIPSRGGLSVTFLVRPLGPGTALVAPGRGHPRSSHMPRATRCRPR